MNEGQALSHHSSRPQSVKFLYLLWCGVVLDNFYSDMTKTQHSKDFASLTKKKEANHNNLILIER